MPGGGAENIVTAMAKAIRIFCTENHLPPRMGSHLSQQGGFDRGLFKHMRSIVHIFHILTTENHPAEFLASIIMKGNRRNADENHNRDPFLPNVVLVGRDAAHASTCLVKRPRSCLPPIQHLFFGR